MRASCSLSSTLAVLALLGGCSDDSGPTVDARGDLAADTSIADQAPSGEQVAADGGVDTRPTSDSRPKDGQPKDQATGGDGGACVPYCGAIGSKSEGWYDGCTKQLIGWAQCASCKALCKYCGAGCLSGGYYSSCNVTQLIKAATCVECKPKCDKIGTFSEGWYDGCTGALLKYATCSGCTAKCNNCGAGCKSNGYYSSCDSQKTVFAFADCVP